ncbi:MAG: XdhC family protein [Candidatus Thiodiazotropha lotti]|uniref:XdhC family protein n=1 Tax=Candidatus Thiodiazotropha lotti TaxID=2792787 RepID=A0A9E4N1A5_9GAMM|nr:XdhC family protein [Candidatus Thiodiazotropha lotti]MCG7920581.1 XdhC family protein [Candidatus Thiodiazotropha lotti]MCG7940098.1 XdhC family protein [Candidatus Thiodiazotropha lotti]MCG7988289.1 XdhC family protein [Candidatus Thiodiazotropha lotti]MCG8003152.1 XdhC family protein [Candidatus Thiodiazotropha lotti]
MGYPDTPGLVSDDLEVIRTAAGWLDDGVRVALVTVLKTWGSSPRPPGALLAIHASGHTVGSVSGGCVEETLVTSHRNGELGGARPSLVDFGVANAEAERLGLPCGGRLELMVELLNSVDSLKPLLERMEDGQLAARRVALESGEVTLQTGGAGVEFEVTRESVTKVFGPAWQLLLVGNGQIARHLAQMAISLDYRVTICDPRSEFIDQNPLVGVHYSKRMPDDEVRRLKDVDRTAVVTLAHDPRQDDLGLTAALERALFYIGALGSRRSAEKRRARLTEVGHSADQIDRIHAPAGLAIGSKRPAEIALSILAQITAVRNRVGAGSMAGG